MGGKSTSQNQNQFQIQNQTTQSAPWAVAQPGLQQSLDLAQRAANTTYNGSSVAALDPLVTQGQNLNLGAAAANQPGQMANNFVNAYQPLLANGGVSALGLEGLAISIRQQDISIPMPAVNTYNQATRIWMPS
jgi:hypothetical protein